MPKKEEPGYIEALRKKTENLLKEVQCLQEAISPELASLEERSRIGDHELSRLEHALTLKSDGHFDLRISEDEMVCMADFYPPTPNGAPIDPDKVQERLHALGVVHGIDWESISNALVACNIDRKEVLDVVVARGTPPTPEVPAHYVLEEQFQQKKKVPVDSEERVDYRTISPFTIMKKGDLLAKLVPLQPGMFGRNVRGREIPYPTEPVQLLVGSKNLEAREDGIYATADGILKIQEGKVSVEEILQISGNVDYHTGNIDFPGDLIIGGDIQEGFKVRAGGTLLCDGTIYASDIFCKGDLIVKGGIIGKGKSKVIVEGSIQVRFLEHCYIESKGNVYSEVGALHSIVYTLGKFQTGKKGLVVGGKIYAQEGIYAAIIGTLSSPKTELLLGNDYQVHRKLEWIRDKSIEISVKLKEIDQTLKRDPRNAELVSIKETLHKNFRTLADASQRLIHFLTRNEKARLQVWGMIVPGTYIEICNVSFIVPRILKRVTLYLNRKMGRVEMQPFTANES